MRRLPSRRYTLYFAVALADFFVVLWILAPIVHELWHLLVLKIYGCDYYSARLSFSFIEGISGEVEYYEDYGKLKTSLILLSGILGNILVGQALMVLGYVLTKKYPGYSVIFALVGFAFMLDSSLYFYFEMDGDMIEFLKLFDVENREFLPFIGSVMILLSAQEVMKIIEIGGERYVTKYRLTS